MLAAVARRRSGSRSFNRVFPRSRFAVSGAVDARDRRRGRAGGAGSPLMPVYIDILRKVVGYNDSLCRMAASPYPACKI